MPASVNIDADTTVESVKIQVAKAAGLRDHHRIGVYDPTTKTTLKNRNARILDIAPVVASGEVLIKDMGAQIPWRTVFLVEYFGPIMFHPMVLAAAPYIYFGQHRELNNTQKLSFVFIMLHSIKRELETIFVHKFSAATMPIKNVVLNSSFYWGPAGLLGAYEIYSPWSLAARPDVPLINIIGIALFVFGQIGNARVHLHLSRLRKPGETVRQLPGRGYGFSIVTCPNYMFEVIAWSGIILVSRSFWMVVFICIGISYMAKWGKEKEQAYRKQFGDKYKNKRYVMLPGIL